MAKKFTVVGASPNSDSAITPHSLGKHGTALWRQITSEYEITDAGGVAMLAAACAAWNRAELCRESIDREGELVTVRGVPREHPLLKAELANRAFTVRTLQKLGLNFEPVRAAAGRPGYA